MRAIPAQARASACPADTEQGPVGLLGTRLLAWHLANKRCTFLHYNLVSEDWLFGMQGEQTCAPLDSNTTIFDVNIIAYQTYMMWPSFI